VSEGSFQFGAGIEDQGEHGRVAVILEDLLAVGQQLICDRWPP